ncbi:MAG: hypothetical protein PF439_11265 [Helicobacteraceae bacterium]|jgi:hypothetical protein|nr:hypothetical protein [Helicobacteraceae bacterium]
MKKIALFFFYTLLFFGALLFFTPKESLYYYAEEQLKPVDVVIAYEEVIDHGFSLELRHAQLYVQKIKSAEIGSASFTLFGLYNAVSIDSVVLDKTFEAFFPPLIQHIDIVQSLVAPLDLTAEAVGDFGEAEATVHLLDRSVDVIVKPSKLMLSRYKSTLRQLKKSKEGDYSYEYKF